MVCESTDFKYKDMQVLALTLCKSLTNTFFFSFQHCISIFFLIDYKKSTFTKLAD